MCKQTFFFFIPTFTPFLSLSLCLIFSQQTFPLQLRGMFHVKLRPFYPQDLASRMAVGQHAQIQLVRTRRAGWVFSAGLLQSDDTCSRFPRGGMKRQRNRKNTSSLTQLTHHLGRRTCSLLINSNSGSKKWLLVSCCPVSELWKPDCLSPASIWWT